MNNILLKINQIVDEATFRLSEIKKQQESLNRDHLLLQKGLDDLKIKNAEFSKREANLVPIENLHTFKQDAQDKLDRANALMTKLLEERKLFDALKNGESQRLQELRITTQRECDNLQRQRSDIPNEVARRVKEVLSGMNIKK
jgi:hypothetical protein